MAQSAGFFINISYQNQANTENFSSKINYYRTGKKDRRENTDNMPRRKRDRWEKKTIITDNG